MRIRGQRWQHHSSARWARATRWRRCEQDSGCGADRSPILYYIALIGGAATYPGYDHSTRYASELGAEGAPYPQLFNYSIIAMGAVSILGAIGLALCLRELSGRWLWPALACVTLSL